MLYVLYQFSGPSLNTLICEAATGKLGRRWWKVWNKVLPGDRCWQSRVLVDQVCQRHEWVVPGIAARYREELCSSVLHCYTVCAPGPAASEGWRVHLWCGWSISDWRSAIPLHGMTGTSLKSGVVFCYSLLLIKCRTQVWDKSVTRFVCQFLKFLWRKKQTILLSRPFVTQTVCLLCSILNFNKK